MTPTPHIHLDIGPDAPPLAAQARGQGLALPSALTSEAADWNPLDDEFEGILDGSWAVIRTADGWEIESQHCQSTYPLESTDMEAAKIEGAELARRIETRFLPNA